MQYNSANMGGKSQHGCVRWAHITPQCFDSSCGGASILNAQTHTRFHEVGFAHLKLFVFLVRQPHFFSKWKIYFILFYTQIGR